MRVKGATLPHGIIEASRPQPWGLQLPLTIDAACLLGGQVSLYTVSPMEQYVLHDDVVADLCVALLKRIATSGHG